MHPLGLCNSNDEEDLYEYGWVGVVKLEQPELEPKPCLTVLGKVREPPAGNPRLACCPLGRVYEIGAANRRTQEVAVAERGREGAVLSAQLQDWQSGLLGPSGGEACKLPVGWPAPCCGESPSWESDPQRRKLSHGTAGTD